MAEIASSKDSLGYRLVFTINETSTSVANNTSTVTWSLRIENTTAPGYSNSYAAGSGGTFTVNVNGVEKKATPSSYTVAYGAPYYALSGSTTITHNSDGKKTISFSFSRTGAAYINIYSSASNMSGSGSLTLSTIARATTPTISSGTKYFGTAFTVSANPADSSFKHTIQYKVSGASGYTTVATQTTSRSVSVTVPATSLSLVTNDTKTKCVINCITYTSSGSNIGSKQVTIDLNAAASVRPSISKVDASDTAVNAYNRNTGFGGRYIQNLSKVRLTITSAGIYGSTIKSSSVTINGKTYSNISGNVNIIDIPVQNIYGNQTAVVKVKDSRGRESTAFSKPIYYYPYKTPTITTFSAVRANQTGGVDAGGTYCNVTLTCSIASTSPTTQTYHTGSITITGKDKSSSSAFSIYSDSTLSFTNQGYTNRVISYTTGTDPINRDKSYDITVKVIDTYGGTIEKTVTILPTETIINWGSNKKSMAIGMISSNNDNQFEVGYTTDLKENVICRKELQTYDVITNYRDRYSGQYVARNAAGKPRWSIYTDSAIGAATSLRLNVFTDDTGSNFKRFVFNTTGELTCDKYRTTHSIFSYLPLCAGNIYMRANCITATTNASGNVDYFTPSKMNELLGVRPSGSWDGTNTIVFVSNSDNSKTETDFGAQYWKGNATNPEGWSVICHCAGSKSVRFSYLLIGWC